MQFTSGASFDELQKGRIKLGYSLVSAGGLRPRRARTIAVRRTRTP
jgi:hypothetical protein